MNRLAALLVVSVLLPSLYSRAAGKTYISLLILVQRILMYFLTWKCAIQVRHFQPLSDFGCSTGSTRAATCQEMVTTPSCMTRSGRRDRLVHHLELWGSKDRMKISELGYLSTLPSIADAQQCRLIASHGLLRVRRQVCHRRGSVMKPMCSDSQAIRTILI